MGNKQSIRREQQVHPSSKKDGATKTTSSFTPSTHTLSSLKANKSKGYTFTVPKNTNCWDNNMTTDEERSCIIGGGEFGDREFVPVDSTRCLLRYKGKTEAILLRNYQTQTIHICSFIPPGNEKGDGHPLFEWGVIGKSKRKSYCTTTSTRRCNDGGYTMTTPFDGSYYVRGVTVPSLSSSNQHINSSNNNNNNNNMMVVTSSQNDDNKACATFEETDDKWVCHTMYGIDPIMMVCFIVALDTLRTTENRRSGSVISHIRPPAIGMLGNSSNGGSRFSLLTSSKLLSSSLSSNGVGNKMTKNNSSNTSSKILGYGYSKRNSNGSCSYMKSSSSQQQHDMPPITSFINARAA